MAIDPGTTAHVERVHGCAQQFHGANGHQASEGQRQQRTSHSEKDCFAEKCSEHGPATCSQRAHHADLGPPPHH